MLAQPLGSLPALGPLLSPFTGFWRNLPVKIKPVETYNWETLNEPVEVVWDANRIPHIFAKTESDLHQVQGYLHARDRLFQMDLSTRAAQGTLSEILGKKVLKVDRFFVSIGMRQAVQNSYEFIMADDETRLALESYALGVNRWIESLHPNQYPVEYKLIGIDPSPWSARRSVELLKVMAFRLSGRSYDMMVTRHLQKHGKEKTLGLFPFEFSNEWFSGYEDGKGYKSQDLKKLDDFVTALELFPPYLQPFATNGSNNWAVSSKRTGDGHSYLANDTHLKYSSPAVWYEQQLVTPGNNVYGAAFAGAPGVMIGFKPTIGWGMTNGNTDAVDWAEVEFKDSDSLEYLWDGEWIKAEVDEQVINVKNSEPLTLSIKVTKVGRVVDQQKNLGLAVRWQALEPSNEVKAFLHLTRSKNLADCKEAVSHLWNPTQNAVCASPEDVAIYHAGKIPIRTKGDGQFVRNGRTSAAQWKGFVPFENIPKSESPKSGLVWSANAQVAHSRYPFFVTWDFNEAFRGIRIKRRLEDMQPPFSIEKMIELQTEFFDLKAELALPLMLKGVDKSVINDEILKKLEAWDFVADANSIEALVYNVWWGALERNLYFPALGARQGNLYPKSELTIELMRSVLEGKSKHPGLWVLGDDKKADLKEKLTRAYEKAIVLIQKRFGGSVRNWSWGEWQVTRMDHLIKIPAFGAKLTTVGGAVTAVNANAGNHGAAWRQIVKLGEDFKAKTNYPGGQSGNPFDPSYHQFVKSWGANEYRDVKFFMSLDEAKSSVGGE